MCQKTYSHEFSPHRLQRLAPIDLSNFLAVKPSFLLQDTSGRSEFLSLRTENVTIMNSFRVGIYLFCFLAIIGTGGWFLLAKIAIPAPTPPKDLREGNGFLSYRSQQKILHLSGSAYAMGYYHSQLLDRDLRGGEATLLNLLNQTPNSIGQELRRQYRFIKLWGVGSYLTPHEASELLGLSLGSTDPYPELKHRYARLLNYHTLHDLPPINTGKRPKLQSSTILVNHKRGEDGHAFIARNIDFENNGAFPFKPLIIVIKPNNAFGFVSIAWPAMIGVISGMNEHGLTVALSQSVSSDTGKPASPLVFLARRILEETKSVQEAAELLVRTVRFGTGTFALADSHGNIGTIEVTPSQVAIKTGDILTVTNHLKDKRFKKFPSSQRTGSEATSLARQKRLDTIISEYGPSVGPRQLVATLRDRQRPDGRQYPLGHKHSVDSITANHSLLMDAKARIIWLNEGPHTLGKYNTYDVRKLIYAETTKEVESSFLPPLDEDPLNYLGPRFHTTRMQWKTIETMIKRGDLASATSSLHHARTMADHPVTLRLRGQLAEAKQEYIWALQFYQQALESPPEFPDEKEVIQKAISRVQEKAKL